MIYIPLSCQLHSVTLRWRHQPGRWRDPKVCALELSMKIIGKNHEKPVVEISSTKFLLEKRFSKKGAPKFQLTGPTPCQETLVGSAEPFPTVKGSLGQTANSRGQTAGFDSHLARRLDVLWDLLQLLLQSTFSWTWKHWHLASKLAKRCQANILGFLLAPRNSMASLMFSWGFCWTFGMFLRFLWDLAIKSYKMIYVANPFLFQLCPESPARTVAGVALYNAAQPLWEGSMNLRALRSPSATWKPQSGVSKNCIELEISN